MILQHIEKSTLASKIPCWRSTLRGAWLRQVVDVTIRLLQDVQQSLVALIASGTPFCTLIFSHPEIRHGLTNDGISQVNIDQLNPKTLFSGFSLPDVPVARQYGHVAYDGDVYNFTSLAMQLTRGKLLKTAEWGEWQQSEFTMLDQYEAQGLFGTPVKVESNEAVLYLVWIYVVKELDKRKEAQCTCDGSPRSGQVRILDHTYANCVNQMGCQIFYAVLAAKNLLIYGTNVSNPFAEAPPPKQGFYIRPDKAFLEWWASKTDGHKPIPPGYVIPVMSAMQGHPESPRLWAQLIDRLLRDMGFTPTIHKPCLYSGLIDGQPVLFMRQVDDFVVAAPTEQIANRVFDMLDDRLMFPIKCMGLISLFNGLDIAQTADFVKILYSTYLDKVLQKHLSTWLSDHDLPSWPMPLPTTKTFITSFLNAKGIRSAKQDDIYGASNNVLPCPGS